MSLLAGLAADCQNQSCNPSSSFHVILRLDGIALGLSTLILMSRRPLGPYSLFLEPRNGFAQKSIIPRAIQNSAPEEVRPRNPHSPIIHAEDFEARHHPGPLKLECLSLKAINRSPIRCPGIPMFSVLQPLKGTPRSYTGSMFLHDPSFHNMFHLLFHLILHCWGILAYPTLNPCSPPQVDRIWGRWGSYYNIPKAIFYLLKEDYRPKTLKP